MLKQIFFVLILYIISWWIIYSLYYKYGNKDEDKDYTKDGLYGFIVSLIYFALFTLLYICVSNFSSGNIFNLKGMIFGSNNSSSALPASLD